MGEVYKGFEPFFDADSRVLILGSFPSVKSREVGFYYGNKRNRFFEMLSRLFGEEIGEDVSRKKDFLKRHKIALYDTVSECEIKGSSDGKISRYRTADICYIFDGEFIRLSGAAAGGKPSPKIEKILLNGKKAYEIFMENYPGIPCVLMPSTSPANVSYDYEKWAVELSFLK
ncbi:MAG: DNA-deoxyinosine glycosylase [Clostridiales bacterium]|jgi:hypoxanthine-DNA glycosylase|nr:DNA-deoxyinosine glycosylase [Clostridiales bacterium]